MEEWSNDSFSRGCQRKDKLRCSDGDVFLALPVMKAPDKFIHVKNKSTNECAAECARNCSCVAYAYANLGSSFRGETTRCLVWVGELIDAEKVVAGAANLPGGATLHLRIAGLDTAGTNLHTVVKYSLESSPTVQSYSWVPYTFMWKFPT
jgi:hypothetical protein